LRITTDNFPIYLAFACTAVSLVAYIVSACRRDRGADSRKSVWARRAYFASVGCIAYATIYLLQQILSQARYDIDYIYSYSGPGDELLYRVSSLWAGQEGSLLLWAMLVGIVGVVLVRRLRGPSGAAMAFWSTFQLSLLILLLVKCPFAKLAGYQPGVIGAGLNPLLKNPWMAVHPPVLFLGYAALAVPAAMAIQALIEGDLRRWAGRCLPWALLGWVLLGSGIFLGMVWSYEVTGWGGFWGWDSVENASLIPWLTSTALVHGLIVQRYRGRMAWPNIMLALGTFLLVFYAAFLTRSGVLKDVSKHSFAGLGAYKPLLGLLIFYAALCIGLAVGRVRSAKATTHPLALSKDFAVAVGAIALVLYAAVVLVGTSAPLFSKSVVAAGFYNRMSIPIAVAAVVLIVLASALGWSRSDGQSPARHFNQSLWKSGSHIAHLGVLISIVGIVASTTGGSRKLVLGLDEPGRPALGYTFKYTGISQLAGDKERVNLTAKRGDLTRDVSILIKGSPNGTVTVPHIVSSPAGDLYISPGDQPVEWPIARPVVRLIDGRWESEPARIPESDALITLTSVRAEERSVKLLYEAAGRKPVEVTVADGKPAAIDGYELTFAGYEQDDKRAMSDNVAVKIAVTGNGLVEKAIIEVIWKPLIWLLWLGLLLIVIGGLMACRRRFREKRTIDDGILPDSP